MATDQYLITDTVNRHYFIDEGGDGTLFSRTGRVLIDTEGCSRFFILGLLHVSNPTELQRNFDELRAQLLSDPYFAKVPSMQTRSRKTAFSFHAKDDLPEVRKEVFALLRSTQLRFYAIIADKWHVLKGARKRAERQPGYRYHPNELYENLIPRLFRERLHQSKDFYITFSKRGKSNRTAALRHALKIAQAQFAHKHNLTNQSSLNVSELMSRHQAGLQAVDYFTWALQRLFERGEERYVQYLWDSFRFVQDIHDRRIAGYGAYYTQKAPLNAAAMKGRFEYKKPGI